LLDPGASTQPYDSAEIDIAPHGSQHHEDLPFPFQCRGWLVTNVLKPHHASNR
jgi:hypothetical protein